MNWYRFLPLLAPVLAQGGTCAAQPCQPHWAGVRAETVPHYDNFGVLAFDDGAGSGPGLFVLEYDQGNLYRWRNQDWELLPRNGLPATIKRVTGVLTLDDGDGPAIYSQMFANDSRCFRWRDGVWTEMPAHFWPWNGANRNRPETTADFGDGIRIYGKRATGIISKWSGTNWEQLGQTAGSTRDIDRIVAWKGPAGLRLHVFGSFTSVSGVPALSFATWDGLNWAGPWPEVVLPGEGKRLIAPYDDGSGEKLYTNYKPEFNAVTQRGLHRWDGYIWKFVGGPIVGPFTIPEFHGLFVFDDGSGPGLYLSGIFSNINGITARSLVRYDSAGFHAIPGSQPFTLIESYGVINDERGQSLVMRGGYTNTFIPTVAFLVGCHTPTCPADCNADDRLNVNDYVCFTNAFAARNPFANAQPDGLFDVQDFVAFMNRFSAGCPQR